MLPRYGSLPISSISRYFIVELFVNNHSFQVEAALLVTQYHAVGLHAGEREGDTV